MVAVAAAGRVGARRLGRGVHEGLQRRMPHRLRPAPVNACPEGNRWRRRRLCQRGARALRGGAASNLVIVIVAVAWLALHARSELVRGHEPRPRGDLAAITLVQVHAVGNLLAHHGRVPRTLDVREVRGHPGGQRKRRV